MGKKGKKKANGNEESLISAENAFLFLLRGGLVVMGQALNEGFLAHTSHCRPRERFLRETVEKINFAILSFRWGPRDWNTNASWHHEELVINAMFAGRVRCGCLFGEKLFSCGEKWAKRRTLVGWYMRSRVMQLQHDVNRDGFLLLFVLDDTRWENRVVLNAE